MFYDNFKRLCDQRSEKPYTVIKELGAKTPHVIEQWKKGSVPRQPMLQKIADHFGVSIDYLLTGKEKSPEHKEPELSNDELSLLSSYRSLTEDQKNSLLTLLRAAAQEPEDQADS